MNHRLFSEFSPTSTEEWEKLIHEDLNGADYTKKLIWDTGNKFTVKPYYRKDDLAQLDYLGTLPGKFPFIRGKNKSSNSWIVREDIFHSNIEEANHFAKYAIDGGANSICFYTKLIDESIQGVSIVDSNSLSRLLSGIDLQKVLISFEGYSATLPILSYFMKVSKESGIEPSKTKGSLGYDPLGELLEKGSISPNLNEALEITKELIQTAKSKLPAWKVLTVHADNYHNSAATTVQELAYTLSHATEYLAKLTDKGLSVEDINSAIQFSFSISANYFFEIAKYRAFRMLWSKVLSAYSCPQNQSAFIHATVSEWNKTIYDPHVNMLRGTTEALSAAIAGVDSISVTHFDSSYSEGDEFSHRIARNIQNLLKHESHIDKVVDPAAGSYYIEALTDSIAKNAWELFQEIESKGGFLSAIQRGDVQSTLAKRKEEKEKDLTNRKDFLLGINQYPLLKDFALERLKPKKATHLPAVNKTLEYGGLNAILSNTDANLSSLLKSLEKKGEDTIGSTIRPYRASEPLEQLRLQTEQSAKKTGKTPSIFLLQVGNLAMRIARATFASNFFGCAGYDIHDHGPSESVAAGVETFLSHKHDVIIICSSDDEYPTIVPEVCKLVKEKSPNSTIVLAGFPKDLIDTFKSQGVFEFIHVRSNLLETLHKFQSKLGVV